MGCDFVSFIGILLSCIPTLQSSWVAFDAKNQRVLTQLKDLRAALNGRLAWVKDCGKP
jgi:hypothetical protein